MSPSIIQLDTGRIIRVVNGKQSGYACDIMQDTITGKVFRTASKVGSFWTSFTFMNRIDYTGNKFAVYGIKGGEGAIGIYDIATGTWGNIYPSDISQPFLIIGNYIYFYDITARVLEKRTFDEDFTLTASVNIDAADALNAHNLAEDTANIYAGGKKKPPDPDNYATINKYDTDLNLVSSKTDSETSVSFGGLGVANVLMHSSNGGPPATYYYYLKSKTDFSLLTTYTKTPDFELYSSTSGGQGHAGTGYHFHGNSTVINSADGSVVTDLIDYYLDYSPAILSFSATKDYFSYISSDYLKIYIYDTAFNLVRTITV